MQTRFALHPTPLGDMLLVLDDSGLRKADFLDQPASIPDDWVLDDVTDLRRQIDEYFSGQLRAFHVPLAPTGTAFQQRVWAELQRIPYGRTTTYGAIAAQLGDPKCVRAVGTANGANPIAVLIPCHRVIGRDGSLVGYAGGLRRKEALLRVEGVGNPLF